MLNTNKNLVLNVLFNLKYLFLFFTVFLSAVDKQSYMVGSYCPKSEAYEFTCPIDEAPKGMLARGHYNIKSKFIDDDKTVHLAWEWSMDIKKDWA